MKGGGQRSIARSKNNQVNWNGVVIPIDTIAEDDVKGWERIADVAVIRRLYRKIDPLAAVMSSTPSYDVILLTMQVL